MKKNYIFMAIAACIAILTLGSCSLEEENPSAISTDQEWTSASGYEKLINGCYYNLVRTVYGQAEDTYIIGSEGGSDIWQYISGGGNWEKALIYSNDFGSNTYMFDEAYKGFYGCLNQCNAAIYYADKVTGLSEDAKNALAAEAHFLRAHALYAIVEYWGGKYLATTPTTSPITTIPTSKVNEFYDVILEDLDFAKKYLPTGLTQDVNGHVTRAAAYHLDAKAALTYSTYTDGLGNCDAIDNSKKTELLNRAKESADYLINNASSLGVSLYSDINDVFNQNNNKKNKEALFVVTHSTVQAYNPRGNYYNRSWKHWDSYNNNSAGICLGGITPSVNAVTTVNGESYKLPKGNSYMTPSKYMFDLYGEKDGRYHAFFIDTWYINNPNSGNVYSWVEADANRFGLNTARVGNSAYNINKGDTAIYIARGKNLTQAQRDALRYATYNLEENFKDPANPGRFYPTLRKNFCNNELLTCTNANKPFNSLDCIIYRLAETYLLSAEIAWRLGDNNTAAQRVNVIRNRACIGHDGSMNVSASDINANFLLDEYAREMIGEWQRWMTLKRFRMLKERLALNPQIKNWSENYYFRPVMQSEIDLMENGDEYQNPGY